MSLIGLNELRKQIVFWPAVMAMIVVVFCVQVPALSGITQQDKLVGRWEGVLKSLQGELPAVAVFEKKGGWYTGTITSVRVGAEVPLKDIKIDGNRFTAKADIETPSATIIVNYAFTLEGETMKGQGSLDFGGNTITFDIELKRTINANTTTSAKTETLKPPSPTPKDTTPPKIVITSPQLARGQGVKPAGSRITVTGQATDESGVSEVMVRDVKAQLNVSGNFSAEVLLKVGDNQVTVTATDIYGNRATESFTVRRESETVAATPAAAQVTGRYFALVIGNNRYPNLPPEKQLKTAINDAQEMAKLLRADYGFETKLLTDAKRAEIIKALNDYSRSLKPDDNLLIYYAGHGHFDDGTGKAYWIPTDAEMNYNANWIIADDVTANVRAIPARHILIVSDSCYSGTLTRATDFRLSTPAERERYLEKMRGGTARLLMASGGNEPVTDGGGSGHSVFARALLNGLRGMDERVFTAEELFHEYIKQRVAGKSDQTPEYNPLRNSGHEAGDFVFVRVK